MLLHRWWEERAARKTAAKAIDNVDVEEAPHPYLAAFQRALELAGDLGEA